VAVTEKSLHMNAEIPETGNHRVGISWFTLSILKREKTPVATAFGHRKTEALWAKVRIYKVLVYLFRIWHAIRTKKSRLFFTAVDLLTKADERITAASMICCKEQSQFSE